MSLTARDRLGSSSPCKGEDRWGSAASKHSQMFDVNHVAGLAGEPTAYSRCRPATPSLTLPLLGGGKIGEVDR